jgi:8-oxo-dGTP diphosphatase
VLPATPSFLSFDTRLAAYVVIRDEQEQILLVRANVADEERHWTLPGGEVELDETIEEGAVREVFEETGLDVALHGVLTIHTSVIPAPDRLVVTGRALKRVGVVYRGSVLGGQLRPEASGSTDAAQWFATAELDGLALSSRIRELLASR